MLRLFIVFRDTYILICFDILGKMLMKFFFSLFFSVLSVRQTKQFVIYIVILFIGSITSVFGIGAVIPFITVLISPEKIESIGFLEMFSYKQLVVGFAVIMIVCFWLKNIVSILLLFFQTKFLNSLSANIQQQLFTKYMRMPYETHLSRSTPELVRNVVGEVGSFSNGVLNPLGLLITDIFSLLFIVLVLLYMNFVFSISIILSLALFLLFFMNKLKAKMAVAGKDRAEAAMGINKNIFNGLMGIKEIKLYHKEKSFENGFNHNSVMLKNSTIFNQFYQQLPRFLIEIISITVVLFMLVVFICIGESASQLFILLSVYGVASAQLLPALNRSMNSVNSIKYSMQALVNVSSELNSKDYEKNSVNATINKDNLRKPEFKQEIRLESVCYRYPDGTRALDNISLNIRHGQKTAFVGTSGAGKSTLVDLLMGFYTAISGSFYLDGDLIGSDEDWLCFQKLFAYIPQQIILYNTSIRENIAFGESEKGIDENKIWQCLEMAQMANFVEDLDDGIDTFLGENGVRLSGGQRQRIGIARALYQEPEILVMDEATSALDNETEKEVTNVIKGLRNITIITIAHRLSTIEGYDVVYRLEGGKLDV